MSPTTRSPAVEAVREAVQKHVHRMVSYATAGRILRAALRELEDDPAAPGVLGPGKMRQLREAGLVVVARPGVTP